MRVNGEFDLVTAGFIALDIVVPPEGVAAAWRRAGGTAGNVAAISAILGLRVAAFGSLGKDRAASELLADLALAGVREDWLGVRPGAATPRVLQEVLVGGTRTHRFSFRCPECGSKLPGSLRPAPDLTKEFLKAGPRPKVFFFDRPWPSLVALAQALQADDSLVFFEPPVLRSAAALEAAGLADIVKVNHALSSQALDQLRRGRPSHIIQTRGAEGATLYSKRNGRWSQVDAKAPPSKAPRDTAGAGDWTTGILIRAIVSDQERSTETNLLQSFDLAMTVAAASTTFVGARGLASAPEYLAELTAIAPVSGTARDVPFSSTQASECALCLEAE